MVRTSNSLQFRIVYMRGTESEVETQNISGIEEVRASKEKTNFVEKQFPGPFPNPGTYNWMDVVYEVDFKAVSI
jgi:hypothetical protein